MSDDRTEKPTPKRLRDARDRGQVARSKDLAAAAALIVGTLALAWLGPGAYARMASRLAEGLRVLGETARTDIEPGTLSALVWADGRTFALIAGPLMLTAVVMAVGAQAAQHGVVFAKDALKLNWERLSPSNGIKKLAPGQAGVELVRASLAAIVIGVLAWQASVVLWDDAPRLVGMTPGNAAIAAWDHIWRFMWRCGLAMAAMGVLDYGVQYYKLMQQLKMTKQEIRDEYKLNEGNPEVKGRVRRIQMEMSRRRMLAAVKTASVVITNPTHYAVALEYKRGQMAAPKVVAKGKDALAAKIRAAAREHSVPIMENPPLARALHANAEVGDFIPPDLFAAVAEVLAYLVRIKQLVL